MKLKTLILGLSMGFSIAAFADDELIDPNDGEREPAAVSPTSSSKRAYPGGADEEDLMVQARLPEAGIKTDARNLQRGVYKNLYNQEMKEERTETVEE